MLRGAMQTMYLAAGVVIAYQHAYLGFADWMGAVSALGAVAAWPLVLMGVNMHLATIV